MERRIFLTRIHFNSNGVIALVLLDGLEQACTHGSEDAGLDKDLITASRRASIELKV